MAERALATAFVNIVPGTKDFESKLKSQLTGQMPGVGAQAGKGFSQGFGSSLKKLAGLAVAAFSVSAVANFGKETILLAEDVEVANNRLDQIAKSMGVFGKDTDVVTARLKEYAEANEAVFAQDAEVIKSTQAKLLTFKELALTADVAGGSFDRATQAAFDLAAAGFGSAESNATQLGKALQDPIKGLTALGRSGVTFTEAEKERIKTLVESNQVGKAQEMVLAAIEAQVGGTAAATAKASDRMKLGFESIKEGIGGLLLPAFESFSQTMATSVFPAIQGFIGQIKDEGLGSAFSTLGTNIMTAVQSFISGGGIQTLFANLIALRTKIITAIAEGLPAAIQQLSAMLVTALPQVFQGILSTIPVLLQNALLLFRALVDALVLIVPILIPAAVDMIVNLIQTIVSMLPSFIDGAIKLFTGLIDGIIKVAPLVIVALLDAIPRIVRALVDSLPKIVDGAIKLFLGLVNGLVKVIPILLDTFLNVVLPKLISTLISLVPILIPAAIKLFLALVQGLAQATPQIIGAVLKLIPQIIKSLADATGKFVQAGIDLVKGLVEGIIENGPELVGNAIKTVADGAVNLFKDILGIASPSKVFREFGKNIIQGLQKGLLGGESSIKSTMDKVASWVSTKLKSGDLSKKAAKAAQALVKSYSAQLMNLEREQAKVLEKLEKAQDRLADRLEEKLNFVSNISEQYGANFQIDEETTAAIAIQALKDRIAKTRELGTLTDKLLEMGLNEDLYRQIVEAQAVDFARSIIEGGAQAVQELNILADEAGKQALALAERVGSVLFDQGIRFAESIVQGLEAEESRLTRLMERVAASFSAALNALIAGDLGQKTYVGKRPGPDKDGKKKGEILVGKKATWRWDGKKWNKVPELAKGGFVNRPTTAIIGEAGPEVVTPLKDFERMTGLDQGGPGKTINYYAAPNQSIDSERALFTAMKRAEVIAGW